MATSCGRGMRARVIQLTSPVGPANAWSPRPHRADRHHTGGGLYRTNQDQNKGLIYLATKFYLFAEASTEGGGQNNVAASGASTGGCRSSGPLLRTLPTSGRTGRISIASSSV